MAYWSLITYTRPDTSKDWYVQDTVDEIKAERYTSGEGIGRLLVALEESGKLTHYSISESNDGLKQYIKLGFDNKDTFDKFILDKETAQPQQKQERDQWLESFNITCDIQNTESEPTITL